mmetsp:Transcript_5894/g.19813  ORF Transcript_5894/g.19813 Transcript_5894/m.19813 type:complete len:203 (-) Transcript_5894:12-620(-)
MAPRPSTRAGSTTAASAPGRCSSLRTVAPSCRILAWPRPGASGKAGSPSRQACAAATPTAPGSSRRSSTPRLRLTPAWAGTPTPTTCRRTCSPSGPFSTRCLRGPSPFPTPRTACKCASLRGRGGGPISSTCPRSRSVSRIRPASRSLACSRSFSALSRTASRTGSNASPRPRSPADSRSASAGSRGASRRGCLRHGSHRPP